MISRIRFIMSTRLELNSSITCTAHENAENISINKFVTEECRSSKYAMPALIMKAVCQYHMISISLVSGRSLCLCPWCPRCSSLVSCILCHQISSDLTGVSFPRESMQESKKRILSIYCQNSRKSKVEVLS